MKHFIIVTLLFCFVTPAFANQGFIEAGYHVRKGTYHPRSGVGLNGVYAFNRQLKLFHPELMAGGWFGTEDNGGVYFPGSFAVARLDDTVTNRTFADQQNIGVLGTGRIVFDFGRHDFDEVEQGAKVAPEFGFGVGGYQLFRKHFPARETNALAELFFRLHFFRKSGDTFIQVSSVRSFGLHRDDAINADYPEFAYTQISLGFELPFKK